MKERPYIGVTGPKTIQEVRHLITTFETNGVYLETGHQPMIGFLVSHETFNGQKVFIRRYPSFEDIPALLGTTNHYSFNTIHYNSKQMIDLADQIKGIFTGQIYNNELCRGVQLNIPWPPVREIIRMKRLLPDLKIIMQLSQRSLEGKSPSDVAKLLARYSGFIEYVLIDPSAGRGKSFQPGDVVPYYSALRERFPNLAIGLAGGFTGENVVERCREIIDLVGSKDFSTDAEGGLRDKLTDEYGDDVYNSNKVESYIKAAKEVFL